MPRLVAVEFDDWAGLYVDEKLVHEGHSITYQDVLDALNISHEERWLDDTHQEWIEARGRLPQKLSDIPTKKELSDAQEKV